MTYFNTTNVTGARLRAYREQAGKQDAAVLDFFLRRPTTLATPFDVHRNCDDLSAAPVTSVRRAMTNLTALGFLEKTRIKQDGPYGRPCCCWRLNRDVDVRQPELF